MQKKSKRMAQVSEVPMHYDWQRNIVYAWEQSALCYSNNGTITIERAVEMLQHMALHCGVRVPSYDLRKKNGAARANFIEGHIQFDPSHIRSLTPIHEFAHYVNSRADAHGPYFVRVYIDLLVRFTPLVLPGYKLTTEQLWDSAVEHKVCVARKLEIGLHPNCTRRDTLGLSKFDNMLKDLN